MSAARILAGIGLRVRRAGPWARMRSAGLATSTAMLVVSLFACAFAYQIHQDRERVARSIHPVETSRDHARLLYSPGATDVNDRPVSVVTILPLEPAAPLPPGLDSWPNPGEAVLSPALIADLGAGHAARFGRPAGVIGAEGLVSPTDRLVYRRPPRDLADPVGPRDGGLWVPVSSFGARQLSGFQTPASTYGASLGESLSLILFALVVPSLIAVAVAAGVDGAQRARRAALLDTLGASRLQRAVMDLFESLPALAAGALIGAVLLSPLFFTDVAIGWLDTIVTTAEARESLRWLVAAVLAAPALAVTTVLGVRSVLSGRRRKDSSTDLSSTGHQWSPWRVLLCLGSGISAVWLPLVIPPYQGLRFPVYLLATAVFAVSFPALLSALLGGVGSAISRVAMRSGHAGVALGGRRLRLHTRRTARILLGVCGLVLIAGQVQLVASALGETSREAIKLRSVAGTSALQANPPSYGKALRGYLDGLPGDVAVAWTWTALIGPDESKTQGGVTREQVTFAGSCAAIELVAGDCQSPRLGSGSRARTARAMAAAIPPGTHFRVDPMPGSTQLRQRGATLWLLSVSGDDLPLLQLRHRAYEFFPAGMSVDTVAQGWVVGARQPELQGRWTVALGLAGVMILLLATVLNIGGDVVNTARSTRSTAVLSEGRSWLAGLAMVEVFLPVVVAVAASAAAYYILPSGMRSGSQVTPSLAYPAAAVAVAMVVGVCVAAWSAAEVAAESARWRPGLP